MHNTREIDDGRGVLPLYDFAIVKGQGPLKWSRFCRRRLDPHFCATDYLRQLTPG